MHLDVGNGHYIYFEEYGNPAGVPILFIHGGPGLGCSEGDKVFFDPDKFHVIFIDQRGCGKSIPKGELAFNTTEDLLVDMISVLDFLNIEQVVVFGGSWGATLAILLAAKYSNRVIKLIIRGFFSATSECMRIYLRGEIRTTHPENWERVSSFVPSVWKGREAEFYFMAINEKVDNYQLLGQEWARYGLSLSRKYFAKGEVDQIMTVGTVDYDRIRIELHYALNHCFISESHVFDQAVNVSAPTTIIHGRYDYICPLEDAMRLDSILIDSTLKIADGGHSTSDPEIKKALFEELNQLQFKN
ncbi:MAG: alpha/beta fold hydrolase [Bacteroidota bacterium]